MGSAKYIPYQSTHSFSNLVVDYLSQNEIFRDFITDFPSIDSIKQQVARKEQQSIDRDILANVLHEQYEQNGIDLTNSAVGESIAKLKAANTFTICTAHQPNIFTGYLYTIYKIIHTINLAKECQNQIPNCQFVPVFFIGSEDNDIDEIGAFNFKGKKYQWQPNEQGACGRFSTNSLLDIRDKLLAEIGSSEVEEKLKEQIRAAYDGKKSLAQATQYFLHSLFEEQGLVVLDADDKRLKHHFKSIIQDELTHQTSHKLVTAQNKKLSAYYKIQVEPRELNLFYLTDGIRERIEKKENAWTVVNTDFSFDNLELVDTNPELFSPNVILRPLYQETILPNIAFIGGGSEVAYWIELQSLFEHYKLPFPILFVRNSVSVVADKIYRKMEKIGFEESFKPLENALKEKSLSDPAYIQLLEDLEKLESEYNKALQSAQDISPSLEVSAKAHLAKIINIHDRIKTKYRAHIKREYDDLRNHKIEILDALFPNDKMQERYENYLELVVRYKKDIITHLLACQKPLEGMYCVLSV